MDLVDQLAVNWTDVDLVDLPAVNFTKPVHHGSVRRGLGRGSHASCESVLRGLSEDQVMVNLMNLPNLNLVDLGALGVTWLDHRNLLYQNLVGRPDIDLIDLIVVSEASLGLAIVGQAAVNFHAVGLVDQSIIYLLEVGWTVINLVDQSTVDLSTVGLSAVDFMGQPDVVPVDLG